MTTVSSGQTLFVSSGQASSNVSVQNGGTLEILSGGLDTSATISTGGTEIVLGLASATTVSGQGKQTISAGGTALSAILAGGQQYLSSGATATATTVSNGGFQQIGSGAIAIGTYVSNGTEYVSSGAIASATTLSGIGFSNGYMFVFAGGVATGTTVGSGGRENVFSGGVADGVAISGGTFELRSGASAGTSPISFFGTGGVLQIDGSSPPANTISGFAVGDLIDLAGTNLGNAAAVQLKAGNLLEVTENGNAYDLHLDPSQNFAGTSFHLAPDINGGTAIALGQATTVSSGQTVSNTSISNGNVQQVFGTAVSATVVNFGDQVVLSGGAATATVLSSGGYQEVASGGVAFGTIVSSNGAQGVDVGAIASAATVSRGTQYVFGSAVSTTVNWQQNVYGAAISTIVAAGEQLVLSGGTASATLVTSGGYQEVDSGGTAIATVVISQSYQQVQSGGIVSATTIGSTGSALITSGGASIDPIISGGTLELLSGASLGSSAITFAGSGGTLLLDSGVVPANTISGFARGDVIDLSGVDFAGGTVTLLAGNVLELSVNGSSYDLQLDPGQDFSGQTFHIAPLGGFQGGTTIAIGQVTSVISGQTISNVSVTSGNIEYLYGTAVSATMASFGEQQIFSGGIASVSILSSGGYQEVDAGGTAIGTKINSAGAQAVFSGGTANSATIAFQGLQVVISGATVTGTSVSGTQLVRGTAVSTTIANGTQKVFPGGIASNTVLNGGLQFLSGGAATSTTVINGTQVVSNGGIASATTLSFGVQDVYSGGLVSGTILTSGSTEYIVQGGTASATIIGSGAHVIVSPTELAAGAIISGGSLELGSGAVAGIAIAFAGPGGILQIDGPSIPADTISGLVAGDTIDLASVGFVSGATATLTSGNVLQVIDNATAYNLQLDPAQSFANVTFRVSGDGSAGTAIVPVQHVIVSSGQVVSGATVASANVQDVYGTAINANVQNGGEQDVYSGGTGSGTLISSGGVQAVFAGGTASAATVSSGGVQYVSSSGIALAATIASGGYQSVASGGFASNTLVTGGEQDVSAGAGARDTTISGGIEQIQPGANVGGTIGLLGSGSTLKLVGTQTFDGATVAIGYTTGATLLSQDVAGAAATLTLGPNLMITHAGALAALGTSVAASSVVNQGTVNANFAGGDFDITAASFTNQHLISVANGDTLAVGSTQFTNTAAGTVTVGAGTLALGYQSLLVDFEDLTGSGEFGISNPYHGFTWETPGHNFDWLNGTTLPADSGYQIDNIAPGHNVAYDGFAQQPIDIKRADGSSFIFQSVDLAAAWDSSLQVTLTGYVQGKIAGTSVLTVNDLSSSLVTEDWGPIDDLKISTAFGALDPHWSSVPSPNSQLVMDNFSFLLPSAGTQWSNQGQINVLSGGELRLGGNLTNASLAGITNSGGTIYIEGTLTEAGQSLNVGSGTALGAVVIDHTGKLIGAGTISGPINDNGTIEANGTVAVTGPVTGNGQLVIDANSNLVVGGAVAQAVAFNGTNATLTLNNPAGFTGTISGLAPDDMIDLVNTIVTSATIEGFVLELTESDGSSLFYQINGALTGNSFSVQSDLNGGTLLVLNTTVPYGSLFDASGLLTTDINDGVSADQITSDALRIYTTGVAGAIGTLGGAEWQRAYETSNTNATDVGVDIANAAGTSQIQSAAVNLFGTIIAGAVGSVADGAQHAAYQNILQAANTLGTDIGNGAGINQLKSDVESLYATIAGAAISSPAWQQAVSASDQAATTLGNDLAANAASSQILGDIANLYDTIVAGALGAIGGTTLQQAYTAGPSVITLGTDVANSASATQVQIDLAGLYKSVIAGVDSSATATALQQYQSSIAAADALGGDLSAGAGTGQIWYDTESMLAATMPSIVQASLGDTALQQYNNFAAAYKTLTAAYVNGDPSPETVLSLTTTAVSNIVGLSKGLANQNALDATTQAATQLAADVNNGAAATTILSDVLNLYAQGLGTYALFNQGASAQQYADILQTANALNAEIENGTFNFDNIQFLLNFAFEYNSNLRNLEQELHLDTFANTSYGQDEWQIEFPAGNLVQDLQNNAGADRILSDAGRLYDALVAGVQHKLGTNQLLGTFGVKPSTLVDDIADGNNILLGTDGNLLAYELADPCDEEVVTTVNTVMSQAANVDALASLFKMIGLAGKEVDAATLEHWIEQAVQRLENARQGALQEFVNSGGLSDALKASGLGASQGFLQLAGAIAKFGTPLALVDLGVQLINLVGENTYGKQGWKDFNDRQIFNFNEFAKTLHLEADLLNPFAYLGAILQGKQWPPVTFFKYITCWPDNPPPSNAWGDVHLTTYDGLHYDFQAAGEFVLTQSILSENSFQVQARLQPWGSSASVSVMTMVGAQVGADRVTFGVDRPDVVLVNGAFTALSPTNTVVNLDGGQLFELSPTSYRIVWYSGESMNVVTDNSHIDVSIALGGFDGPGLVKGLLGPELGQASDFQLADGTVLAQPLTSAQLYGEFANAWRVTDASSLLDYGSGQNTGTFTDVTFPGHSVSLTSLPQNLVDQAAAKAAAAGITDPNLVADAELDYIATGDTSFITTAANVQQQGVSTTQAQISPAAAGPAAVGVGAPSAELVESNAGPTPVTFQVYLTSASSSSTPVDYAVVVPGAGFFDASSLGGGLPSGELVISAGQTSGQFTINVPQGALGTRPSEDLAVAISTPDGNPIFAATAQVKVINDQPEPGNPAIPAFEVLTNLGTLTSSGNDYTLDLGALPKGSTPQIKVAVANSTAAPADELGGIFAVTSGGSAVTFSGIGQLVPIAAGRVYDGIQATVNTGALGANSATLAFTPQDLNESGYSALLSNLTLTIKYSTKLAAQAVLNSPTNIVFGNVRVGSEQKQAISVTNAAVAGAASLDASLSLNGAAAQFGTIYQLAPGATDATSLSVGLNTSAAGAASGFATLMLFSDGGSGTTEPLPSEQIEVFGRVFRLGATSISPIFAHVGDPTTKTLPITNTAAADGYSENIVASVIGTAGGVTGSGTTGQVVPQLTNSGIVLGYSTAAAGVVGGITIDIQSDGTNVDGLAPLDLGQQTLPVTINNYAQAAFEESFGGGTLTHSGNAYTLDLGTLVKGSGPVTVGLGARNSAAGPSDLLSGSFAISGSGPFTNSGFAAFAGVGAGQINNGPSVTIDTVSAGTFSETITLTPIGYNAGGYAGALAPETLTITGTVASGSTQFVSSGIVSSGVVVSNGNTLEVLAGGTANVTTVLSGGAGNVAGLVTSTNVVNGGTLNILPGGLEDSGVVASGGSELVSSGGVAGGHGFDTTILNGGAIYVLSGAHVGSSLVSGGGTEVVSFGGVAGRATIFGLQNVFGQTNSAILKSGGLQNVNSGASVTNTVFSGGTQSINSGAVVTGAIVGKGVQRVSSGGLASATTISSGGLMQVLFAGTAKAVGVQSGGTLELFGGAVTSQTTFASGAFLEIGSGYVASGIAASGGLILEVASGGTADATTVSSGGSLQILFSGAAINASIQSGGSEEVASGASASGDRVASGGSLQVDAGGVALGTIISGGMQTVLGGGLASGASISNGGVQAIASGGTASGTILSSGGQQNVASGGSAIGTVVGSGGIANVSAGGSVSGIVLNAASGFELLHGSATATQVSGGIEAVLGGGVATGASVGNTGIQYVGSGGLASGTTVLSGGQANVDVAGSAGGVTVSGGGVLLDAGSATSAVLMSGAAGYVRSAGTAFATLVLAGAADIVSSGGVASGSVLSGGVEAVFGGATVGTNVERNSVEYVGSGVASGTVVSLRGQLNVASGGVASGAQLGAGSVLIDFGQVVSAVMDTGAGAFISSGGSFIAANVTGADIIESGGVASGTELNGGVEVTLAGGVASAEAVNFGGIAYVASGGLVKGTVVGFGGQENIAAGGVASGGTISANGLLLDAGTASAVVVAGTAFIGAGGKVVGLSLRAGGADQVLAGGVASGTTFGGGGTETVMSGGVTSGALVGSGGLELVTSGGIASGAVISGGTLEVASGGSTGTGAVTFVLSAGGILQLDDAVHYGGLVAGFGKPDFIDLRDIAFNSATTTLSWTQSGTSGTLAVADTVHSANITLLGQYVVGNFTKASDGHGGTLVGDPPVTAQTDQQAAGLVNPHHI